MDETGWTWDEIRAMPSDVVAEFAQMRSIKNQVRNRAGGS